MNPLGMYIRKRILILHYDLRAWRRRRKLRRALRKAKKEGWRFSASTPEETLGMIACQYSIDNTVNW